MADGGEHEVRIDVELFVKRAQNLYKQWEKAELFKEADSLVIVVGKLDDDMVYSKSTAFHIYFFAYEFPDTILVFSQDSIVFVASAKKLAIFRQVQGEEDKLGKKLEFIERNRHNAEACFDKIWQVITTSRNRKTMGVVVKDVPRFTNTAVNQWTSFVESKGKEIEEVDIGPSIGQMLSIKSAEEQTILSRSGALSAAAISYVQDHLLEDIISEGKKVTQENLAVEIEAKVRDPDSLHIKVKAELVDTCYFPTVESGGVYDLRPMAPASGDVLKFDTIIIALGARYRSYCSNVARTYMIDPTKEQLQAYRTLHRLRDLIHKELKPGVELCQVYNLCVEYLKQKRPHLVDKLTKNVGFGTGIEFRDSHLVINHKNRTRAMANMVFNVCPGFQNIENLDASGTQPKSYSLLLADTVFVQHGENLVLTERAPSMAKDVCYLLGDEDKADAGTAPEAQTGNGGGDESRATRNAVLQTRTRAEDKQDQSLAQQRQAHQKMLLEKINREARKRLLEGPGPEEEAAADINNHTAYKSAAMIPADPALRNGKIAVDRKNFALLLPIFGEAVPFHVSMIKNVSVVQKIDQNEAGALRINFQTPGLAFALTKQTGLFSFAHPEATFLRELTYRSADQGYLEGISQKIKDMQKLYKTREAEAKEKADLVHQGSLKLSKPQPIARLPDLMVRPAFGRKNATGSLEAHVNGFRYSIGSDRLDILYSNIRYAFFQPCKGELIVLLHFHLKDAIMGPYRKKQKDIQFYTEVVDGQIDLGNRYSSYDRDELEAEQKEQDARRRLDRMFYKFTEKIDEVKFEVPERKLGFYGVPLRSNVLVTPTTSCLVSLVEQPVFVLSLDDVELVHLERVQFGSKNFDMTFIFKNYGKLPCRISSIPMASLDKVKQWLDEIDIKYSEGTINLNWAQVMKTIAADPQHFFDEEGGWGFLEDTGSDDAGSEESEQDDEVYEPSDVDDEEESEYSEDESDSGGSDYSESEEEDEDEGMTWEELEEQAKKEDRRNAGFDTDEEEEEETKKKRKASEKDDERQRSRDGKKKRPRPTNDINLAERPKHKKKR